MSITNQDDNLIVQIDNSYSTDYGIGVSGWILSKGDSLERMEICVDDLCVPVTSWHSRPDVIALYPDYKNKDCGFNVHIPRHAKHELVFNVKTRDSELSKAVLLDSSRPRPHNPSFAEAGGLFSQFAQLVNEQQLKVLEVGSRVVSPGSSSTRPMFSNAASYTGFDYYPDDNTDVVGDAHKLSSYFGNQRFDAIFSCSVFEHLAMPWLVAKEINRLLEIGGITFHATHNAWPIHERPWDFWRFSDESLKVLFSSALGFEVMEVGYFQPARLYLDNCHEGQLATMPMHPAFGGVAILARKVAEIDLEKFNWNVTVEEILGTASHYPAPAQMQIPKTDEAQKTLQTEFLSDSSPSVSQPAQTQLQKSQASVQRLRRKIQMLETKLKDSETEIAAMQSSKFWKIRSGWIRMKKTIGIQAE